VRFGDVVTINSRKYDGTVRRSWTCRFLSQQESLLTFEGLFETEVLHPDLGLIAAGTRSLEYYWLDRWYNVFHFFEPTGEFRNLYCNINVPPTLSDGVLDYVDLDVDVMVWPDARVLVLDEDDFEKNAAKFKYPAEIRKKAVETLAEVRSMIVKGIGVFKIDFVP
jgi:protein associated with RNAse G/E